MSICVNFSYSSKFFAGSGAWTLTTSRARRESLYFSHRCTKISLRCKLSWRRKEQWTSSGNPNSQNPLNTISQHPAKWCLAALKSIGRFGHVKTGRISLSTVCATLDYFCQLMFGDTSWHDPEGYLGDVGTWSVLQKSVLKMICTQLAKHVRHHRLTFVGMTFSLQDKRCRRCGVLCGLKWSSNWPEVLQGLFSPLPLH